MFWLSYKYVFSQTRDKEIKIVVGDTQPLDFFLQYLYTMKKRNQTDVIKTCVFFSLWNVRVTDSMQCDVIGLFIAYSAHCNCDLW